MKDSSSERGLGINDYLVMNWADDVNYMFTSLKDAKKTIKELYKIGSELDLPFSREKCKLVPIYPRKFPKKKKLKIGSRIGNLVTVAEEAKILGIRWR